MKAYGASPRVADANGSRMIAGAKVKARIAQIRAFDAAARRVTLPFLTAGLLRAAGLAEATAQPAALAQAYMGIAKLHGFLVDKQQIDVLVRRPSAEPSSPDEMSEEEWLAKHGIGQVVHSIEHDSTEQVEPSIAASPDSIPEDQP